MNISSIGFLHLFVFTVKLGEKKLKFDMLLLNSFISVIFVQLFEDFCIPNLGATGLNADTFLDQEYFYSIEVAVHHHYT